MKGNAIRIATVMAVVLAIAPTARTAQAGERSPTTYTVRWTEGLDVEYRGIGNIVDACAWIYGATCKKLMSLHAKRETPDKQRMTDEAYKEALRERTSWNFAIGNTKIGMSIYNVLEDLTKHNRKVTNLARDYLSRWPSDEEMADQFTANAPGELDGLPKRVRAFLARKGMDKDTRAFRRTVWLDLLRIRRDAIKDWGVGEPVRVKGDLLHVYGRFLPTRVLTPHNVAFIDPLSTTTKDEVFEAWLKDDRRALFRATLDAAHIPEMIDGPIDDEWYVDNPLPSDAATKVGPGLVVPSALLVKLKEDWEKDPDKEAVRKEADEIARQAAIAYTILVRAYIPPLMKYPSLRTAIRAATCEIDPDDCKLDEAKAVLGQIMSDGGE